MSALHSKQTIAQGIHGIIGLEFANLADRAAGTVANPTPYVLSSADIGKVGKQNDDGSIWILTGVGPIAWMSLAGGPVATPLDDSLVFAAGSVGTSTTGRFLPFGYTPNPAPAVSPAFRSPRSGTASKLRVRHNGLGSGGNITYTLWRNGTVTALSCSFGAGTAQGSDLVNSVSIVADDLLELRVSKSGSISASPTEITATIDFGS